MKKLLTLMVTLAAVAVFTFGIAACGKSTNGDDSVTTLPDAQTAYAEAMNAENYKIKVNGKVKDSFEGEEDSANVKGEVNYDFANKLCSQVSKIEGGKGFFENGETKFYAEVVGDKIYNYNFDSTEFSSSKWETRVYNYTEEKWIDSVEFYCGLNSEYDFASDCGFPDSLDGFTFDEKTKTFVKEFYEEQDWYKFTVSFRDGKLYRLFIELNEEYDDGEKYSSEWEYIFSFGNASVSIPQEAKNAPLTMY